MSGIGLDSRLVVSPDVVWREVGGEAIILQLADGQYFGLNDVGTVLWKGVVEGRRLRDVLGDVVAEFDVSYHAAERDLVELLQGLVAAGLLVAENTG